MPLLNVIVEDGSPLITYTNGKWIDSPTSDASLSQYSAQSYHTTASNNAKVTFTFNGTSVSIVGGMSSNYGTYTVQIDGGQTTKGDAFSETRLFNQTLGGADNLAMGTHTLVLTNTATNASRMSVDVDFITFGTPLGGGSDLVASKSIGADDISIAYFPDASDWSTDNSSGFPSRFATENQANLTTNFMGNAVAVFGSTGPSQGPFLIDVDGAVTNLNSLAGAQHESTLLYFMQGLDSNPHSLALINTGGQMVKFSGFQFFLAENPSTLQPLPSTVASVDPVATGSVPTSVGTDAPAVSDPAVASETPFLGPGGGFTQYPASPTPFIPGSQRPLGPDGSTSISPVNPNAPSSDSLSGTRLAGIVAAVVIAILVMGGFLYRIIRLRQTRPSDPFDDRRAVPHMRRMKPSFARFFHRNVESPEPRLTDPSRDSIVSDQSDGFVPVQRPPMQVRGNAQNPRWRDQTQLSISEYHGGGRF